MDPESIAKAQQQREPHTPKVRKKQRSAQEKIENA
jgi:hypothetical protein